MTIYTVKRPNLVYTVDKAKKENILGLFLFWGITIFLLWFCWYSFIEVDRDIIEWLKERILLIPVVLIFLFSTIFMSIMALKKPIKIVGTLIEKTVTSDGSNLMRFSFSDVKNMEVICFTKESNSFLVNKEYIVYIMHSNLVVISIEELSESYVKEDLSGIDKIVYNVNFPIYYAAICVLFPLLFMIIVSVIGIFLYPKYTLVYIIVALMLISIMLRVIILFKSKLK